MRRFLPFLLAFFVVALGCDSGDNIILLTLRSELPVSTISVQVSSIEGIGPPQRLPDQRVTDPSDIRLAIRLQGPALVAVHVTGRTPANEVLVATRCYAVEGTVEDVAILAGPIAGLDLDGDSFVADASQVCLEPDGEMGTRPCNDSDLHLCDNNRAQDCDDDNDTIFPGATVICRNGIDEDCDGEDEQCADNDGDGSNACAPGETERCDCDDEDPAVNPGVDETLEMCNDGIDQNCDGADRCCDMDGDGSEVCRVCSDAPDVPTELTDVPCLDDFSCSPVDPMTGEVTMVVENSCVTGRPASGDCDDNNDQINPSAMEVCDTLDNNCNGLTDEAAECLNPDQDGDGVLACNAIGAMPGNCEPAEWDCDAGFSPQNREQCDGFDNDIDMMIDEGCAAGDGDGDGQVPPADCDDADPFAYDRSGGPGSPLPDIDIPEDGRPQNCMAGGDRSLAEDLDGDGYVEVVPSYCENNAALSPDATEICDTLDNDCDLVTDELLDVMQLTGCVRADEDATVAIPITFADTTNTSDPPEVQRALFQNCGGCRNVCRGYDDQCVTGQCDCSWEDPGGPPRSCLDVLTEELGSEPAMPVCAQQCGGCADLATDENNCGACGRTCGAGETCVNAACVCGADTGPAVGMDMGDAEACQTGDVECCNNTCVNVTTDPSNCGECNYTCGSRAICSARSCQCDPAQPDWEDCDGNVDESGSNGCETNTQTPNRPHCGSCGNNCGTNSTCIASGGSLACECNAQQLDCTVGRPWCETGFSVNNCGSCGRRCGAGEGCNGAGECTCGGTTAGSGQACGGNSDCCGSNCRDLTQTANCRACGNVCRANETCGASDCQCDGGARCTGANSCCPGTGGCVDTDNNRNNCGGCGTSCTVQMGDCAGGNCRCNGGAQCGGGMDDTCCGGAGCRDLRDDTAHCGACGRSCGTNETCGSGQCLCSGASGGSSGPRCTGATSCCPGDGCVNTANDVNNCGGCGVTCGPSETCSGGQCVCSGASGGSTGPRCTGGNICCPGSGCVDTDDDASNCGGCGISCGPSETCSGGQCRCSGEGGGGGVGGGPICGGGDSCCPGDGCVDTSGDTTNCGGCGVTCGGGESCSGGQCRCGPDAGGAGTGAVCGGGTPDCCPSDGGCTNVNTDTGSCGACGASCGGGESCSAGACTCGPDTGSAGGGAVCTGGTPDCCPSGDGCVDLNADDTNCGMCGDVCANDAECYTGTCRCNSGGDICYDGVQGDDCSGPNCECYGGEECSSGQTCNAAMMMCI